MTMYFLYDLGIGLLTLAIRISALFDSKNRELLFGRKKAENVDLSVITAPVLVFHCASLGEFEMIRPLLADGRLRLKYFIVVTFFSPSGFNNANTTDLVDAKLFLPADTRKEMEGFVARLKPSVFVFVKYDLWFRLIQVLKERNVKIVLINAAFRPNQLLLTPWATFLRREFNSFTKIFVQNQESFKLLSQANVPNNILEVAPDLRFDRVAEIKESAGEIVRIRDFKGSKPLLILGSSWPIEESMLFNQIDFLSWQCKILIAPHDLSQKHIDQLRDKFKLLTVNLWTEPAQAGADILILNTIGVLATAYQYGDIAVIGGGFGKGLHNFLEAAAYGMPILCGPKIGKFPEAGVLKRMNVLRTFHNVQEFGQQCLHLIDHPEEREAISAASKQIMAESMGARDIILPFLLEL